MNIDPAIWGRNLWRSLHSITYAYSNNNKQSARSFFTSLSNLLPCEKCRLNYNEHLKLHPLTDAVLSSRDELMNWLIDVHNEINKLLGKSVISREYAKELIARDNHNQTNILARYTKLITILVIFILIIIIFIILWYKKTNLPR